MNAAPSGAEAAALSHLSEAEIVDLTSVLVQSIGQNPPGEEAATADTLEHAAHQHGLTVTRVEVAAGRPNLLITLPGGPGPGLLLLGHTDVVPTGDGWTRDPFGAVVEDGRIYGRGTTDMKGGLAACLLAMVALKRSEAQLSGPIHLAALVDEEQDGIGIQAMVSQTPPGDLLGCIVAEPTDLQTIIAARGASYVTIDVHGEAAHAGRPSDGRNAIYGAAAIVSDLERWHDELQAQADPLVGPPTVNVGVISGGQGGSIVPAYCRVELDRRLLPGEQMEAVMADLQARLDRLDLPASGLSTEVNSPMDMPGFRTPAEHPLVQTVDAALQEVGGPGLPLGGWTAACDGGYVDQEWGVPTVVLGPGSVSEQAHRADESVGIEELLTAARAYTVMAHRLLS